jgi:hypothetical protein
LSGRAKLPVCVAENFKTFASNISRKCLHAIQKIFTSISFDMSNAVMMVMNHPVLDLITVILNAFEIGELILIGSVFTTMIKVQQNIIVVLIAELNELNDDMNQLVLLSVIKLIQHFLNGKQYTFFWHLLSILKSCNILERYHKGKDEAGFDRSLFHVNLLELVNQKSQWNQCPSLPDEVRKALQNESDNGIHAFVKTRVRIQSKLYSAIQTLYVIDITDNEFKSLTDQARIHS